MIDVSVLVATYQHNRTIRECLDSILKQKTQFSFEIVIGEDGSTDGTREICLEYKEKYPDLINLRLQNRENVIYINGVPTGRFNIMDCMQNARGRYIAFCEGDDFWISENKLEEQLKLLYSDESISGSYHDSWVVDPTGKPQKLFRQSLPNRMNFKDTIARLAPFHTSSFIMKRSDLDYPEFIKEIISFDMFLFSIAASKGELRKAEEVFSAYRKHDGGITENAVVKATFHERRLFLMTNMKSYFNRDHQQFDEVIKLHTAHVHAKRIEGKTSFLNRIVSFVGKQMKLK